MRGRERPGVERINMRQLGVGRSNLTTDLSAPFYWSMGKKLQVMTPWFFEPRHQMGTQSEHSGGHRGTQDVCAESASEIRGIKI